jgi:GntR family transcriptional regulator, rspAB operon transcriptional repressor
VGMAERRIVDLDAGGAIVPQLYERLRERIVRAELLPGETISETEIARAYSVSRQPVREAFIKLSEAGLVQIRPQRGTMISRISVTSVMEARFVREAIEADVARTAATRADPAAARELLSQVEAQKRVADTDVDAFMKLDELFHRTLADAAGTPFAWRVVEGVKAQMDRIRYLSVEEVHVRLLIAQHEAVANAVAKGDADAAEEAMRTHLREILISLPIIAAAHPELFGAGS